MTRTTFPERSGMSSTDHCGFGGKACTRVESAVPILHSNLLVEWLYRNYCCEDAEGLYRGTKVVAAVGHYFKIGWGIKPELAWTSSAETSRGLFDHRRQLSHYQVQQVSYCKSVDVRTDVEGGGIRCRVPLNRDRAIRMLFSHGMTGYNRIILFPLLFLRLSLSVHRCN